MKTINLNKGFENLTEVEKMILSLKDETAFTGTGVGVRAAKSGAMFCNLTAKPKNN